MNDWGWGAAWAGKARIAAFITILFLILAAAAWLILNALPRTAGNGFGAGPQAYELPGAGALAAGAECQAGAIKDCTDSNGCPGSISCENGRWGACMVRRVCFPGERIGCYSDSCASGHQICNSCGTGYGECAKNN